MNIRIKRSSYVLVLLLMTIIVMLASRMAYTDNLHIAAPEVSAETWLNTGPLRLSELRGKVVLVEFWTFGCSNCRHVEPHVKEWYRQFHDAGLEIVSFHSPEFGYERDVGNVRQYVSQHGIRYPVAIDNDFTNWKRFNNRFWPTLYLIDKEGYIRHKKIGEGDYSGTERRIRLLLSES